MAIDQQDGVCIHALGSPRCGHADQGVVSNDHQVRVTDDSALFYSALVGTNIGENGGAASFGAIARRILHFVTSLEECRAENPTHDLHPLTPATMKTNAKHDSGLA